MGARGPAPKLRAVREKEGNPAKRPLPEGIRLPPVVPDEPVWASVFPQGDWDKAEAARLRKVAREQWTLCSKWLGSAGILAAIDVMALESACTAYALFREYVRQAKSSDALKWFGAWVSIAGKLGLTPSSRDQLNPREGIHDADSGWD